MNLFLCLSYFALSIFEIKCTQDLYTFIPEYCEIVNINESLVEFKEKKCVKLSRTELYLSFSFYPKVNIRTNGDSQVKITGYQFRSNEYRKGPIEFMMGLCASCVSPLYDLPHMRQNTNMKCPFMKDHFYYTYNVSPNAANMPPFLPEGRWMLQVDYMYKNEFTIFSLKWYTAVQYLTDFNVKNRTLSRPTKPRRNH